MENPISKVYDYACSHVSRAEAHLKRRFIRRREGVLRNGIVYTSELELLVADSCG